MRLSAPLYLFDHKDSSLKVVPLGSDPFLLFKKQRVFIIAGQHDSSRITVTGIETARRFRDGVRRIDGKSSCESCRPAIPCRRFRRERIPALHSVRGSERSPNGVKRNPGMDYIERNRIDPHYLCGLWGQAFLLHQAP